MARISKDLSKYGFDLLSKEEQVHFLTLQKKATKAYELVTACDLESDLILLNKIPKDQWGEQEWKRYQECALKKPSQTYEDYFKNRFFYSNKDHKTHSDPLPLSMPQEIKSKEQISANETPSKLPLIISLFVGLGGVMILVGGVFSGFSLEFFKAALPLVCIGLILFCLRRHF
ncbi:MAG: hypothetical protein QM531_00685 [Candidatus Pacebacteria bacterium]|nr:hypothetical protein [Candidatus Paceibacterota bacterium]